MDWRTLCNEDLNNLPNIFRIIKTMICIVRVEDHQGSDRD
jgi:hypothetical protein